MTALPPDDVSWDPPAPGAYTRAIRLGEWIAEPVTPLFASWLLPTLEERLHDRLREWIGQWAPRPYHVIVNGWYFYSVNFLSAHALARSLPSVLWRVVRSPRRMAGLAPPLLRHSYPIFEREWRQDLLPRYRDAVARAESAVERLPVTELPRLIDELAELAGDYFGSITALSGAAYKLEIVLARYVRQRVPGVLTEGHMSLLAGLVPPAGPDSHAVATLDWWHTPPARADAAVRPAEAHGRLVATRREAEDAAFRALAGSPRQLRAFRRLLADAQHLAVVREEQVRELTMAWPAMRRAVLRIGEALAGDGVIGQPEDVFFLHRHEALVALRGGRLAPDVHVDDRRRAREEHARLVPPLLIGRVNPILRRLWEGMPTLIGAVPSETALVTGTPASPGRATGSVRVIHGPPEFEELQAGEILVAPLTAPAWTPLFHRAAAVVTDVGSAASHASIIAREYGIPAVVGCGDATARLQAGTRVTVDGSTGNVEPA